MSDFDKRWKRQERRGWVESWLLGVGLTAIAMFPLIEALLPK